LDGRLPNNAVGGQAASTSALKLAQSQYHAQVADINRPIIVEIASVTRRKHRLES
jgi:hypothetical protein